MLMKKLALSGLVLSAALLGACGGATSVESANVLAHRSLQQVG